MPAADIAAYIAGFPADIQQQLEQIRSLMLEIAPDTMESISYAMPTCKLNGRGLVYFAAFKKHIGLYPAPIALEQFEAELEPYKASKGALQRDRDLPHRSDCALQDRGSPVCQTLSRSSQALRV